MGLIMLVASEPMPLYPHINDYPVTSTCTSSAHYKCCYSSTAKCSLASHPHSILQHQSLSVLGCGGRAWRLKTTLRKPIWEFSMKLQSTYWFWHMSKIALIPCDRHSGSTFSQARGKLEYNLYMSTTTIGSGKSFHHLQAERQLIGIALGLCNPCGPT